MPKPYIADTKPKAVALKAGETVWWCSCGRSKTQPFCDGSHEGTEFLPVQTHRQSTYVRRCAQAGDPG